MHLQSNDVARDLTASSACCVVSVSELNAGVHPLKYGHPLAREEYKWARVNSGKGSYKCSCYKVRKKPTTTNSGKHGVLMVNDSDTVPTGLNPSPDTENVTCYLRRDA